MTSQRDRQRQRNAELEEVSIRFRIRTHVSAPPLLLSFTLPDANLSPRTPHRGQIPQIRQPQALRERPLHAIIQKAHQCSVKMRQSVMLHLRYRSAKYCDIVASSPVMLRGLKPPDVFGPISIRISQLAVVGNTFMTARLVLDGHHGDCGTQRRFNQGCC